MLKYIMSPLKIVNLLRQNPSPNDIALGVCLAMFFGFTPLNGPMALLLAIFFFVFKMNGLSTLLTLPLFKIVYLLGVKSLCNVIGVSVLVKADALNGFWAWFTGLPVIALLGIDHTLVTGGFILAAVLSPAVFFISRALAIKVSAAAYGKIKNTKFGMWLTAPQAKAAPAKAGGMLRRLKIINVVIIIAALVVIHVGTGLVISPLARSFIVEQLNTQTGSRLMVDSLNVWPLTLSVSLGGVKVFDNNKADTRIVKLDHAAFSLSPIGLLSGRVVISRASLSGAEFIPEGIADTSFTGPKVKAAPKGESPWELASVLKTADKNKDLAGRVWQIVKKSFSKSSADKAKEAKKDSKKVTKVVKKLDLGDKVEFRRGPGAELLEIKRLSITRAVMHLDNSIAISDAGIKIKGLTYDPSSGADVARLRVKGDISGSGSSFGKIDLDLNKKVTANKQSVALTVSITDLDIALARPLYEKSLTLYGTKGKLSFDSRTTIDDSAMNSRNEIVLRGQNIVPVNQMSMVFGLIPASALCEAINSVDPLTLKFNIGGTVDEPQMKGLEQSLMDLAKPYLQNVVKKQVMGEGQKLMDKFLNKGAAPAAEGAAPSSEAASSGGSTGDKAMEAIGSLFK